MKILRIFCCVFLFCAVFSIVVFSSYAAGKKDTDTTSQTPTTENKESTSTTDVTATERASYFHDLPIGDPSQFHEVWGYVMKDREYEYKKGMPITDLCYFGVEVDSYGELEPIPKISNIKGFKGRIHLVAACSSRSLTHFVLDPKYGVRKQIIASLAKAAKQYDGIQIDYELVPKNDGKHFLSFLTELREKIGDEKWLTVCVPARVKTLQNDVYDYKTLVPLVDRIIVMAYDEHWSTSAPGAVASMKWCERIADYCVTVIPKKKLVMGLPFYGRTWQNDSYGKAWYFSGVNRILNENNVHEVGREDGVPYFSFKKEITVTGYFDDTLSLVKRCRMYEEKDIDRIAFWRIGQEDPTFWPWISIK